MKRLPLEQEIKIIKQAQGLKDLDVWQFILATSAFIRVFEAELNLDRKAIAAYIDNLTFLSEKDWQKWLAKTGCSIPVQDLYKEFIREAKKGNED
ncbi:hypothetical protein HC141_01980 [Lactobacillus mulieris]|uniref:hypothetical protein n=1 Tax=Lactobacillus mulieris TaxID=2508708 RepID=UPI0014331454|nr:hypothetical protein [Lactobacillus mulieris]MDK6563591.1 hypothetical protein [Lactobacillus mulieris]MDK8082164.1 hypothetical protein [Lactobacillus mulieris]NKC42716.1 hypothetical protein [Lactobacillus mulieris]